MLPNWPAVWYRAVSFRHGQTIEHTRLPWPGSQLESISSVCAWLRSHSKLHYIFLHDLLQVILILHREKSYLGNELFNPKGAEIDWKLVLGASSFGLGWGIAGLCPGPAIMQLAVFSVPVHVIWFTCLFFGMLIARKVEKIGVKEEEEKEEKEEKNNEADSSKINLGTTGISQINKK